MPCRLASPPHDYWECPGCSSVVKKTHTGDDGALWAELNVIGLVKCGSCRKEVKQADVYGGKYSLPADCKPL